MSTRRLIKNIGFLYVLQATNYLVPLLTTPYLARVLGVAEFGNLGLAAALIGCFALISDWGFGYSAVEQVARSADKPEVLRRILWEVQLSKMLLTAICLLGLAALVAAAPQFRAIWPVLGAYSILLVSNMLSLHWFLQGLERLGASSIGGLVGRLLTLPLIFLFVRSPADTWIAAAILTGTLFFSVAISIFVSLRAVPVFPITVDVNGALSQLRAGWHMTVSNGAIGAYTYLNMIVLGLLAGPVDAGLLNGAERIRRVVQNGSAPIGLALYPRINNMVAKSPADVPRTLLRVLIVQGGLCFVLSLVMFVSAPWVVTTFLGAAFAPAIPVVQVLSITPFAAGITAILGMNAMLPLGMKRAFTAILVGAGLFNLALLAVLAPRHGALGAAIACAATETMIMVAMAGWLYLRRGAARRLLAQPAAS